jgi:hypothetical protein
MLTSLLLVALVTICRVVPHTWNLVAVGAVALYAGAKLPRRWAWAVPIAGMALSDLFIDWGHADRPALTISRMTIYGTYVAIAWLGLLARRARGWSAPIALGVLSLTGSALFFLTTNFAEWAAGPLHLYPHTWQGLVACYTAAIPFADKTMVADLVGTALLFGVDALAHRAREGRRATAKPRATELAEA